MTKSHQLIWQSQHSSFLERVHPRTAALGLFVYTAILRAPGVFTDLRVHPDSPGFLHVLALFRGEWDGSVQPFRVEYPVYSYLVFLANCLSPDWLQAAKLAALLPALFIPLLVYAATFLISSNRTAALCAGFLAASSHPFVQTSTAPLYDSTFIFTFALFVVVGLLFIRKPTWKWSALLACTLGFCWATRGLGLFLVFPFLAIVLAVPSVTFSRRIAMCGAGLVLLFATATLIRVPARFAARNLPPDPVNCVKEVVMDGIRYANGNADRDQVVYKLNESATGFAVDDAGFCRMSWPQFGRRYLRDEIRAFIINLRKIIFEDLPSILSPFAVLFIPLALGTIALTGKSYWLPGLFLGSTFVSFIVLVAAIQYEDRYLVPLLVPACIAAGIGCAQMLQGTLASRLLVSVLLLLALAAGLDSFHHQSTPDQSEVNYRHASKWILAHDGALPDSRVMERHHGVYAYLHRGLVMMPVDEPERVHAFVQFARVKYILAGPEERRHNPALVTGAPFLRSAAVFGQGPQAVEILEVISSP